MRKVLKNVVSLAVSPSARYDLIPFIPLELSPWLSAQDCFFAVPAGQSLLVPSRLSSCAAVPVRLPSALPHQVPYFLCSLLPQQLSIMFTVSTEYLPDIYVFSPVFCSLWRRCGSLLDLPARLWEGCRGQGGSSFWGFQLHQGTSFRGLNCTGLILQGSRSLQLLSRPIVLPRCPCLQFKAMPSFKFLPVPPFKNLISASSCCPAAHKPLKQLLWLGSGWKALTHPPPPPMYSFS